MKNEPIEEDEVVEEIPVYLSKSETGDVYLLQYRTPNSGSEMFDGSIKEARLRPHCQQLELVQHLNQTKLYDESKGEQLALNADGPLREHRDPKDNCFPSNVMDRLVLRAESSLPQVDRYAVGMMVPGQGLTLTPVKAVLAMRPALDYLDQADSRVKTEKKAEDEAEEGAAPEETARPVTVRFERTENERMKNARKRSYNYHQRLIQEEPWLNMEYTRLGHSYGDHKKELTFNGHECSQSSQFHLPPSHLLSLLAPPSPASTMSASASALDNESKNLSINLVNSYSLEKQIEIIMRKVCVARFSEILSYLEKDCTYSEASLIEKVQTSATLVQGCWVLKTELVYPKEPKAAVGSSYVTVTTDQPRSKCKYRTHTTAGTPMTDMVKTREYALYLLATQGYVDRSQLALEKVLPGNDLHEILSRIANPIGDNRWRFKLPPDTTFTNRYKEVSQRYLMKWEYQFQSRVVSR